MNASRRGQAQLIAGAGGVLLFIFLFLPWFGEGPVDLSGWEGQSSTDIYLLITAVVAVGAALSAGGVALPGLTINGATALLGGVATLLLLWLLLFDFPDGADRGIGLYLSVVAAAVIASAGYRAAQEEASTVRRERRVRRERPVRERPVRRERP
jgi:hypothetical protein